MISDTNWRLILIPASLHQSLRDHLYRVKLGGTLDVSVIKYDSQGLGEQIRMVEMATRDVCKGKQCGIYNIWDRIFMGSAKKGRPPETRLGTGGAGHLQQRTTRFCLCGQFLKFRPFLPTFSVSCLLATLDFLLVLALSEQVQEANP